MPLRQFAWHNRERLGLLSIRDDALLLHAMKWPDEVRSPDELAPTKKADVDEDEVAWETHDVATACNLPVVGPAPCLNMVLATRDGHVLHQFPYTEQLLYRSPEGWASVAPDWRPGPPHRSPAATSCRPSRPR
ncbi:hypothetical protein ACFU8Q_41635 [Streptomyces sp. NPDC057543]|uniref:hypothetical protein n=1 Tax=Streptomyces sp. NPDC057543 TaxID=3346163 RepID=UPI003696E4E7